MQLAAAVAVGLALLTAVTHALVIEQPLSCQSFPGSGTGSQTVTTRVPLRIRMGEEIHIQNAVVEVTLYQVSCLFGVTFLSLLLLFYSIASLELLFVWIVVSGELGVAV